MLMLLFASLVSPLQITEAASANEADLKCLTAVSIVAATLPEKQRPNIAAGAMYFMGRIDARAPGYDLDANMARLLQADDAQAMLHKELQRCGVLLQERGQYLQMVGKSLAERGKAAE